MANDLRRNAALQRLVRLDDIYCSARENAADGPARGLTGEARENAIIVDVVTMAAFAAEEAGEPVERYQRHLASRLGFTSWAALQANIDAFVAGGAL